MKASTLIKSVGLVTIISGIGKLLGFGPHGQPPELNGTADCQSGLADIGARRQPVTAAWRRRPCTPVTRGRLCRS